MGKRRTEMPSREKSRQGESDDDDFVEEIQSEEPLSEEAKLNIQARKKIFAKRRIGSVAPTVDTDNNKPSPFSLFSLTKTSESISADTNKPSLFSGFKGFSAFTPSGTTTTTEKQSSILLDTSNKNNLPPLTTATTTTTTTTTSTTSSFFGAAKQAAETSASAIGTALSTTATNGETKKQTDESGLNIKAAAAAVAVSKQSITDAELKFINGLNELYEKCYGTNKRAYKLPEDVLNENENIARSDAESKYTYMLAELNKHVSKWISKHVEESPYVILTPVFVDYFNYLITLEKRFFPQTFQKEAQINGHKETKENENGSTTPTTFTTLSAPVSNSTSTFKFGPSLATTAEPKTVAAAISSTPQTQPAPSLSFFAKKDTEEKTGQEPAKKTFEFTKTIQQTETTNTSNASKPSLFSNLTSASTAPVFKFSSDQSSTNAAITTTTPLAPIASASGTTAAAPSFSFNAFGGQTTPSLSLFGKKLETEKEAEKKEASQQAAQTAPSSFFSMLNKDNKLAESALNATTTSTTTEPAKPATPFFSFQSALSGTNKPITTLFGASGDSASSVDAKPSLFGGLKPFGSADAGASIFGGLTGAATTATTSTITGTGEAAGGEEAGEDENYEPPKPEGSDVQEEGSVLTKRCKLYYFNEKEKKYTDRGIGNLFIKPINDGECTQLIVRADTKLANILLNVKLSKSLPITKVNPKDVSYLCMPNPPIPNVDSNVPCKFLFRVKTEDDASELFEKLNEYKK